MPMKSRCATGKYDQKIFPAVPFPVLVEPIFSFFAGHRIVAISFFPNKQKHKMALVKEYSTVLSTSLNILSLLCSLNAFEDVAVQLWLSLLVFPRADSKELEIQALV